MAIIWAISVLSAAIILQTTIFNRITLIQGTVDIVLLSYLAWVLRKEAPGIWYWGIVAGLAVGFSSELPVWLPVLSYLAITASIERLKSRIWQVPVFSLFVLTVVATIWLLALQWAFLTLSGWPIRLSEAFNLVVVPSVVLNLLATFPVYTFIGELFRFIYPEAETE